jgi:pimeloyl-ACP methyl ester carboxylesterase
MKTRAAALGCVLAVLLLGAAPAGAAARECREVTVRVGAERVAGTLCVPSARQRPVVQLLVHGLSYDRHYWDRHVAAMRRAGIATLAIDRVGTGRSSRPPGERVGLALHVATVRGVTRWLRREARFQRVVLVGHSLGTVIARGVAARGQDVAGLVATGHTHRLTTGPVLQQLVACTQSGADGYFTMRAGCRAGVFFAPATALPGALAADRRRPARGAGRRASRRPGLGAGRRRLLRERPRPRAPGRRLARRPVLRRRTLRLGAGAALRRAPVLAPRTVLRRARRPRRRAQPAAPPGRCRAGPGGRGLHPGPLTRRGP